MEWVRSQTSPWGQQLLIGLSWDVAWVALAAAALVMLGHAALALRRRRGAVQAGAAPELLARLPERVLRHTWPARLFHWTMAASMLVLLGTAFLPIAGLKFAWVAPHWIAGLALVAAVAFHIVHASVWKSLRQMWIGLEDLRAGLATLRGALIPGTAAPARSGKNPVENKLFHHAVAAATLAALGTGLPMMAKVDTPWWRRDPYLLSGDAWGIVYVVHGAGSVALLALVAVHLYFALRPDKWWITLSMLRGWIPRERYLERHDPARWPPVAHRSGAALPVNAPDSR